MITSIHLSAFISGLFMMALIVSVVLVSERRDGLSAMFYSIAGLAYISGYWQVASVILLGAYGVRCWLVYRHQNKRLLLGKGGLVLLQSLLIATHLSFELHSAWLCIVPLLLQLSAYMELSFNEPEVASNQQANTLDNHSLPIISWPQALAQYQDWSANNRADIALILVQIEGYEPLNRQLGQEFAELLLMQALTRMNQVIDHPQVLNLNVPRRQVQQSAQLFQVAPLCYGTVVVFDQERHVHEQVAQQLADAAQRPFNSQQGIVELKPHIAIVQGASSASSLDDMLQCAFKTRDFYPEQRISHYSAELEQQVQAHEVQLKELEKVDFEQDFVLYFQPVIGLPKQELLYVELLLRWQHPEKGLLKAEEFIADLRAVGRGYKLAFHVLERAAEMALALKMDGQPTPISINLYGEEVLHDEFVDFAERMVREHNLAHGDLIVECPLPVLMSLDNRALSLLTRLHQVGVHVCLDGLGETPLFLAKLPKLKLSYVKVDPALTEDVDYTSANKALLNGLIDMHRHLKAQVICQGIETEAQLSYIKEFNVQGAQGFIFTQPLPLEGLLGWGRQWRHQQSFS
ncbi:Phytochrome-like protein cph2 [Pseudoalteromonas sp. THAF3]|uniref:EAL domain-containing protein n=1 Tax=Pseudoalteromonas sp. THAF3 TaxID=2587843 RepID=UPI00126945C8|nr:EAL domain-containing protein [Pseudoalteromonas sp. THAF3]QFU03678.1 Phytochrome-like protein cph2 [Pseudoalteromonas sp. THAF3]